MATGRDLGIPDDYPRIANPNNTGGGGGLLPTVLNTIGSPLGINLNPQKPYDDLARSIQDAAGQTRQFSDLQWMRQMEGLQRALGATANYRSTYDKIYGTNNAANTAAMNAPPASPLTLPQQGPQPPAIAPVVRGTATGNYTGPGPDGRPIDGQPRTPVTSRVIPGPAMGPAPSAPQPAPQMLAPGGTGFASSLQRAAGPAPNGAGWNRR